MNSLLDLRVRVACRQRVDPGEAEVAGSVVVRGVVLLTLDDGEG